MLELAFFSTKTEFFFAFLFEYLRAVLRLKKLVYNTRKKKIFVALQRNKKKLFKIIEFNFLFNDFFIFAKNRFKVYIDKATNMVKYD